MEDLTNPDDQGGKKQLGAYERIWNGSVGRANELDDAACSLTGLAYAYGPSPTRYPFEIATAVFFIV